MNSAIDFLFGSKARAKLIKLFVFNRTALLSAADIAERTQVKAYLVRRELLSLVKAGLIKKKAKGFSTDLTFPYIEELYTLLIKSVAYDHDSMVARLQRAGKIKLVIVSGIFTQTIESRIDILIVGDGIKTGVLDSAVRAIEADVGKELRYTSLTTQDFKYRLGIYDRLVRDIMEYPHQKIVNRIGV